MLSNDTLINAAAEFGTPLYVYDEAQIKFQYASLKQAFRRSDVKIFYACKALTNVNILKILEQQGSGIDCVSINEVQLALKAGFTAERIIFTPNSVAFDEYLEATALKVNINIDNLSLLEEFGNHFGAAYPVIIRLNPHIMAGGNIKISTGHVDSKFGISIEQVQQIIDVMHRTKVSVKGLHIHTGSEIKDLEVFVKGLELVLEQTKYFPDLTIVDLGGDSRCLISRMKWEQTWRLWDKNCPILLRLLNNLLARNFRFGLNLVNTWSVRLAIFWFAPISSNKGLQGLLLV